MTIYCYRTGNDLRPATAQEIARYEEMLAAMSNDAGAVDGSEFGHDGPVYMER